MPRIGDMAGHQWKRPACAALCAALALATPGFAVMPGQDSAVELGTATGVPASELRTIGKPNGAFSARPSALDVASSDEGDLRSAGAFRAIDPRSNDIVRVLVALAAVVGVILLLRAVAGRLVPSLAGGRGARPSGVLEIMARYPLGRGQQLLVLRFAQRILLVHQAGTTARTLTEMTDSEEVAATLARMQAGASPRKAVTFKAALQAFENEHDQALMQAGSVSPLVNGDSEIIDLTRTHARNAGRMPR